MTDSESDTSNGFTFRNVNTTVSAKGPNTMISNFSFRKPMTSSTLMPRNFERQRYAESSYDHRTMYYRRETSPMSMHSACDIRPRNFQQYSGMSSQQSVYNGRSGSPMSMRSIDSSASVSAADIAFAFKNVKFNNYDLKLIKEAYHKLMKQRVRKRIEKRRKMRQFLKGGRRRSGDDSGEQGSDSSVSSIDCGSVKTYKENMVSRSRIDLTDFRKNYRDNNSLDNFKQYNIFKNKFSVGASNVNTRGFNNTDISNQSNLMLHQKDRFQNGFLLPSQRFNRSVASSVIMEKSEKPHRSAGNIKVRNNYAQNNNNSTTVSEEEIFSEMTVREKSVCNIEQQRKRSFECEDESSLPDKKKSRIISPIKNAPNNKIAPPIPKNIKSSNNNSEMSNSFEFAKPSLPIRKSKPRAPEMLIAKSNSPGISCDNIDPDNTETTQSCDISSRPSFIKRKLFTQKLDVVEKANLSSDGTNSPQSSVHVLQKEKNKARKLVTNQSCLSREVRDDSNLLDLIHKIIPPDRMNLTNQSSVNQTKSDVNNKDKWDVTSVMSMCKEDDISDTYTDEEIFEADKTVKVALKSKDSNCLQADKIAHKVVNCKVMIEKLPNNTQERIVNPIQSNSNLKSSNVPSNNVKSSGKTFWDTDFESDAECQTTLPQKHVMGNTKTAYAALGTSKKQDLKKPSNHARNDLSKRSLQLPEVSKPLNNTMMNNMTLNNTFNNTFQNNTFNNTRKFNISTLGVRSHRTSKKTKCCNETCLNNTKSNTDNRKINVEKSKKPDPCELTKTKDMEHPKANIQNKKATVSSKPQNIRNDKSITTKSTPQNKKSPKETRSIKDKKIVSPNIKAKKNELKPKSHKQINKSIVKNKEKQNNTTLVNKNSPKPKIGNQKSKINTQKSPKSKLNSKSNLKINSIHPKQNNPIQTKVDNTMEHLQNTSLSGRPLRTCRALSQNRSGNLSGSTHLNNSSIDINKSLRSRVINLSSSIENITIKLKPKNKVNNKNISQMNTRKSDVSFSLASDKHKTTPIKKHARNRNDFFKGRRKT